MKLKLISDIHVEFHRDGGIDFCNSLPTDDVDVLIIAGDFGTRTTFSQPLQMLCEKFPQVIYVPGNHEYYGSTFHEMNTELRALAEMHKNLHMLINDVTKIDGVTFVGSTAWFANVPEVAMFKHSSNDFNMIKGLTFDVLERLHADCQSFLSRNVTETSIVITHYLPLEESVDARWKGNALNCFFVTDCQALVQQRRPRVWCHGHTHASKDYMYDTTRVLCNPLGYPHEGGKGFDEHLTFET